MSLYGSTEITNKVMSKFVKNARDVFEKEIEKLNFEKKHKDIFTWEENHITFIFIKTNRITSVVNKPTLFILPYINNSERDNYEYYDLIDKTSSIDFLSLYGNNRTQYIINLLIEDHHLDPSKFIVHSSMERDTDPEVLVIDWILSEYEKGKSELSTRPISKELSEFNTDIFHKSIYSFQTILDVLNDPQFNVELNEVIFAYNNGKWFIAAAGCGSLLEHLYSMTISNYSKLNAVVSSYNSKHSEIKVPSLSRLPVNATAMDYINALKNIHKIFTSAELADKSEILVFDDRLENRVKTTFQTRNSVSHYNIGLSCKEDVEKMLLELRDSFNTFYIPSMNFNSTH